MDNLINTANLEKAKNLIKNTPKPIIILAQSYDFNRKIIEYGKFDIILDIEFTSAKDTLRQIDSGLNEYLLKTMTKNNISLGIDLNRISRLEKKEKAKLLEKIIQNIKLARKTKTNMKVFNQKEKLNAFSLLISLGASSQQAKQAISF